MAQGRLSAFEWRSYPPPTHPSARCLVVCRKLDEAMRIRVIARRCHPRKGLICFALLTADCVSDHAASPGRK